MDAPMVTARRVLFAIAGAIILLLLLSIPGVAASEDGADLVNGSEYAGPVAPPGPQWDGDHRQPAADRVLDLHRDLVARLLRSQNRSEEEIEDVVQTVLAPPASDRTSMPSRGIVRIPVLLVDFPDAPARPEQTPADIDLKCFGTGDPSLAPYESLRAYYQRSSWGQLDLQGDVYGWYRSSYPRQYYRDLAAQYQAEYGDRYGPEIGKQCARSDLLKEVVAGLDGSVDFSRYDVDRNGVIDGVILKFAGDPDDWRDLFWGCKDTYIWHFWKTDPALYDSAQLGDYVFSEYAMPASSTYPRYHPGTDIHEIGHMLGLPDYYDYDTSIGPGGGVGGWDMMDGKWGDQNAFSKYLLGWLTPTIVTSGGRVIDLQPAASSRNAVIVMPGATLDSYAEFFMVECRAPGVGNDPPQVMDFENGSLTAWVPFPTSLFVWHVDARLDSTGRRLASDNSYTVHKLLRLMEADGAEHLEQNPTARWDSYWDVADLYRAGDLFGSGTTPNSQSYSNASTGVTVSGIASSGEGFTAWVGTVASPTVVTIPGGGGVPVDRDGDGRRDDVNGNGSKDFADVVLFFNQMPWISANEPVESFDFNGNGRIDFADVVWLFNHL